MKSLKDLVMLGDPRLYESCELITKDELTNVKQWVEDLDNVMMEVRMKYQFGRAIAAPQIGLMKRLVYLNIEKPIVFINPEFTFLSEHKIEIWDDCMSFPNLLVKVKRHQKVSIKFRNEKWELLEWNLQDDLAELLQHECDHLDGILCTMRAIDEKSFKWR